VTEKREKIKTKKTGFESMKILPLQLEAVAPLCCYCFMPNNSNILPFIQQGLKTIHKDWLSNGIPGPAYQTLEREKNCNHTVEIF